MNIHDLSHANVDFVTYTNDNALIFKRIIKYINEQNRKFIAILYRSFPFHMIQHKVFKTFKN